jgi:hypothetical protein
MLVAQAARELARPDAGPAAGMSYTNQRSIVTTADVSSAATPPSIYAADLADVRSDAGAVVAQQAYEPRISMNSICAGFCWHIV